MPSRGGVSAYYSNDRLGNLWTLDGTTKNQLGYIDFTGFGGIIAAAGSTTPFGYGGANGCQTEADTGLMLMRHRYYDSRIGRFISQDPAGSGDNWYAYADNNPVNETDPSGLVLEGSTPQNSPGYIGVNTSQAGEWAMAFGESAAYNEQVDQNIADHSANEACLASQTKGESHHPVNERLPGESDLHYFLRGLEWTLTQTFTGQPDPMAEGYNPFKGKTPAEIDKAMREKGYIPRGPDPANGKGGYVNPNTGRSLHIDPANNYGEPPHVDVNRPRDYSGSLPKKKFPL